MRSLCRTASCPSAVAARCLYASRTRPPPTPDCMLYPGLARRTPTMRRPRGGGAGGSERAGGRRRRLCEMLRRRPTPDATSRPAFGIDERQGRQPHGRRCARKRSLDHALRHAAALSQGRQRRRSRACWWWRRCPAISRRCCARRCARCCPTTTSTSPTGTTRAMSRSGDGRFGFDDYVEHMIRFLEAMGPGAHVVAVCQPCVQALAAVAVMAEDDNPPQPRSMTLMAGPIDTRVNPTEVNELATGKPIDWFERNLISHVPLRYPGAGAARLSGLRAALGLHEHEPRAAHAAHIELYEHLANGDAREGRRPSRLLRRVLRRARPARPSSTSRRCSGCSRNTTCHAASSTGTAGASIPRRSGAPRC